MGFFGRRRKRRRWRAWILRGVLALLLLPAVPVAVLAWAPPPTSAFMLQARFGGLGTQPPCAAVGYRWTDWQTIAPEAKLAVVAAEDQRFLDHWGLDLASIGDAVAERIDAGRVRGASTITQQVAKNLFLWPAPSWLRKGAEAYLAVLIELAWPKRRILEMYLNLAQFGPCTFGVEAASEVFFGGPAAVLGRREAALLAAVLPNPYRLDAARPSAYLEDRVSWIQAQMTRLGGPGYLSTL